MGLRSFLTFQPEDLWHEVVLDRSRNFAARVSATDGCIRGVDSSIIRRRNAGGR
jgi:hypothetical protein